MNINATKKSIVITGSSIPSDRRMGQDHIAYSINVIMKVPYVHR